MHHVCEKILEKYQLRNTKKQKQRFRTFLIDQLENEGIHAEEERIKRHVNVVIGNPQKAEVFLTAHYDTCALLPFPNYVIPNDFMGFVLSQLLMVIALIVPIVILGNVLAMLISFPEFIDRNLTTLLLLVECAWVYYGVGNPHTANDNTSGVITVISILLALSNDQREKVCVVLFDNEEKGLLGSKAFSKKYPDVRASKIVLNFDCVSDGDTFFFFPSKGGEKDTLLENIILTSYVPDDGKEVRINHGFGYYPSDNNRFKKSYGICALKKGLAFYSMGRIHTWRDTVFEEKNIKILIDGTVRFIQQA